MQTFFTTLWVYKHCHCSQFSSPHCKLELRPVKVFQFITKPNKLFSKGSEYWTGLGQFWAAKSENALGFQVSLVLQIKWISHVFKVSPNWPLKCVQLTLPRGMMAYCFSSVISQPLKVCDMLQDLVVMKCVPHAWNGVWKQHTLL